LQDKKREYDRLKESLLSLQSHQKFLEEKINDFEEYIKQSTIQEYKAKPGKKSKTNKKFNFTYSQLVKKRSNFRNECYEITT